MKKLCFLVLAAFILSTSSYAWQLVPMTLSVSGDNNLQPIVDGSPHHHVLTAKS